MKNKDDESVLCVRADAWKSMTSREKGSDSFIPAFFPLLEFNAFDNDHIPQISETSPVGFVRRGDCEYSSDYRQIIPYIVFTNRLGNEFFGYWRGTKGAENRLHDKFSVGIGGHINTYDLIGNEPKPSFFSVFMRGCLREINEEVIADKETPFNESDFRERATFLGVINDTISDVDCRHVGFLYVVKVSTVEPVASEIAQSGWFSMHGVPDECYDKAENWSKIALGVMKQNM